AEGGSQKAIIDRISRGYPDVAGLLVLITVSERGSYVIAAARVFTPDGDGKLKRIARFVIQAADAKSSIITKDWPACFASAIRRFKSNPDDDSEDACEQVTFKGTVDGAATKPVSPQPAPVAPSAATVQPLATPAPVQPPSAQSPAASAPAQSPPAQPQVSS